MPKPRILFLTGHLPYPPISGGRRRELELLRRLADRFVFDLHVVSKTPEEDEGNAGALGSSCARVRIRASVEPSPEPGRTPTHPYLVRRHASPEMSALVERALRAGEADAVHVEGFYLIQHVPASCPVPVVLVEQNVEYVLWHQRIRSARTGRERRQRLTEYAATLQAEIAAWRRATLLGAVTEDDRRAMLEALPGASVRLVPNGVDHLGAASGTAQTRCAVADPVSVTGRLVVFVGNFAYAPNVDAARHLVERIFPLVVSAVPDARLVLVGNDPPAEVRALASRAVVVTGRVPSVEPFLRAADVVVCPLREGGGVKVKVLEALRAGTAIVTTPVGAQGLGAGAERALVVAERPRAFARAVVALLRDERARADARRAAGAFAATLPTWADAAAALASCYDEVLEARPVDAAGGVRSEP